MKFKIGDQVLITGGKDKGKKGEVARVYPELNKVLVEGVNVYIKHRKPMGDQPGQRLELARPLPLGKVAILNNKGEVDRIAYQVTKDGQKTRIFKKTGEAITYAKVNKKK